MRGLILLLLAAGWLYKPLPFSWGHSLTQACEWRTRPALGLVAASREGDARWVRWECKGAASPTPEIKVWLSHFPTPAERAAWRDQ